MLLVWFPDNIQTITNHGLHGCNIIKSNNVTIATGGYGNSLAFNGSNSYLTMNLPLGSMNSELTIAFHIWMDNGNTTGTIISCRKTTGAGLSIFKLSGNKWRLDNGNDSNSATYQTEFTNYTIPNNATHHVAIVQTPTQKKLYIDGVLIQTVNSAPQTGNTAQYLLIGGSASSDAQTPTGNWLKGSLNDFRIYNEVLSDQAIARLARKTTATIHKNKQLELWMPLNNQLTSFGTKKITATATAVTYVQGKTGLNATFNGSTSVINTDYVWAPKEGWTIAGWIKHTSATPHGPLVRMSVPKSSVAMDFNGTNGALRCFYYISSSSANVLTTTYIPEQNIWHHYAATYDGSQMKCYVDGELIQTLSCTGTVYSTTGTVQIGNNATSGALTGSIADVRLYNYGLTESEIYELSLGKVGHVMLNCKQLSTAGKDDYNGFGMYISRCACSAVTTSRKQTDSPRYQGSFLANGAYLNLSTAFRYTVDACTFSIWAYAANWGAAAWGTGTYASFLSSIEGGGRGMQYIKSNGNLTFGDAAIGYATTVSADLAAGWHLFTWVIDGWQTKLYIDGGLISSSTAKANKTALNNKGNYLLIGYECAGTKTYSNGQFKGKVSNLEIFTKALTANDISKIYAKAHIPPAPST